jgi:hypothetical protein
MVNSLTPTQALNSIINFKLSTQECINNVLSSLEDTTAKGLHALFPEKNIINFVNDIDEIDTEDDTTIQLLTDEMFIIELSNINEDDYDFVTNLKFNNELLSYSIDGGLEYIPFKQMSITMRMDFIDYLTFNIEKYLEKN